MFMHFQEKNIVPWYSKAEWNDVFKKIYSSDVILQKEGYKKLCFWKVRCPKLPVGVECTMEMLQIHLCGKKSIEVPYSNKDLQLMYSTTLMRFVNQITHLFKNNMKKSLTCYEVAKVCGIPDWIVNIRHDAAHQNVLPSIELLNTAVNYALDWLYNNYWIIEAKEAEDFVIEKSPFAEAAKQKIRTLLNLWQSCQLYKFAGCRTVGDIPNSCLRSHVFSLREVENILNVNDASISIEPNSVSLETYLSNDGVSEKLSIKISDVLQFLLKYLEKLLESNSGTKSVFIKSLVQCELFLPVTYDHDFYANGSKLCGSLSSLWTKILELYHNSQLTTDLLSELAEISLTDNISSRQLVAACWISHITESLCNPLIKTDIKKSVNENKKFACEFLQKVAGGQGFYEFKITDSQQSLLNLNLSGDIPLSYDMLENTVSKVVLNPNQYTILYLPSLLSLLNPPLDPSAKNKIIQLVETYTDTGEGEPTSDIIYTPDMLPSSSLVVSDNCSEERYFKEESIWSKKQGVYDWSRCPFGRLPLNLEKD